MRRLTVLPAGLILLGALGLISSPVALGSHAAKGAVKHVSMVASSGSNPYAFSPQTITIRVGTKVVWRNQSSAPHSVTTTGNLKSFDSGSASLISPNHSWSYVFHRKGRFPYYCVIHPYMKGVVIVKG